MNEQMHGIRYRKGRGGAALKWAHLGTWLFDWDLFFFGYIYLKYLLFDFVWALSFCCMFGLPFDWKAQKEEVWNAYKILVLSLLPITFFQEESVFRSRKVQKQASSYIRSDIIQGKHMHSKKEFLWGCSQNINSLQIDSLLAGPLSLPSFKNLAIYVIVCIYVIYAHKHTHIYAYTLTYYSCPGSL